MKDAEVIDFDDKKMMELNMSFARISLDASSGIKATGAMLSVENVSLSTDDTLLFVVGEGYSVAFALLDSEGGLVHLGSSDKSVAFNSGSVFVSGGIETELPRLAEGEYTLVAYIATADGIRASKPVVLTGGSAEGDNVRYDDMNMSVSISENGALTVKVGITADTETEIQAGSSVTLTELTEIVSEKIQLYGVPVGAPIERLDSESGAYAVIDDGTEITEGAYRVGYEKMLDGNTVTGYVYFRLILGE